jgi:capsular exopolysaccharide synthesis family protein
MIHAPAPAGQLTSNDVWRIIRAHAWLIIIMVVVSGVIGWAINSFLYSHYPRFTATGLLQVTALQSPDPLKVEAVNIDPGVTALEQKTQAALLKSDALLSKVLQNENSEIRNTDWFKQFVKNGVPDIAAAKEDFEDNCYSTAPLPETRLVKVEFTYSKPKDCQTIVREICDQHISDQQQLVTDEGRQQSVRLSDLKQGDEMDKSQKQLRLQSLRANITLGGGDVTTRMGIKQLQLEAANADMNKAETELRMASGQLDTTKDSLSHGIDPYAIDQMVDTNPQLQMQRNYLDNAEAQYDNMRDQYGDANPHTGVAKAAYERQKTKVDNLEAETRSKARNAWMDNLTGSVASATKARDECKAKMESLQNDLSDLADHMISYFSTEQDLKDIQEHEKAVEDQLKTLDYTQKQKLEGKIAWSQKPEVPYSPSFPKLKIILPVALAIGLLLGVGIAFLREMTDTTVRSDRDVVRVQMQLLGMIGDESQDPQATGARLPLVIFDAPHSMTAEQLRQVRTRLQHAASLDTTRSLLITSPSPGDGKTTIACNLAAGLALNGRRILLVDANFRRPEIHKVFALANEQGFSDVLNGAITFDDVVQETQVPNLAVMTSGPKPINATEMFESQLLIDFIERALEEFDHVIFDSGPMMVVSESSAMASRVDGVVTVVRARGNSRGLLTRMRDTLRAIKAEHLGVVLNGVRAQGGGYYGRNIKTFYEYQNG